MRRARAFFLRLAGLFHAGRRERELAEEIEGHLQLHIDDNVRAGMPPEEARRAALLRLGGVEATKEACRDRISFPIIETVLQDFRYAVRTFRRSPGFTAAAVATLAAGLGANTAIFSLIDAVLLKMLPVAHPEQLFFVNTNAVQTGAVRISRSITNFVFAEMQKRTARTAGLAAFQTEGSLNVAVNGEAELASGHFVSATFFRVLGVDAALGRTASIEDDRPDSRVAALSYAYWQRRFGGDPAVLGRDISVNQVPFTIVAVLPREFFGISADTQAELIMPAATLPQVQAGRVSSDPPKRDAAAGTVIARLKPGISTTEAAAELTAILRQAALEEPRASADERALVQGISIELSPAGQGLSRVRNRFSKPLEVLMAVTGLVMLIGCANIAGLLLARSGARRREIAIRLSLGSGRARLIRQLLTESLVLSLLGAAAAVPVAAGSRGAILRIAMPGPKAPVLPLNWDWRVVAFAATVCILNAVLFGILPAIRSTAIDPTAALKDGKTGWTRRRVTLGRMLVVGQVSLSLVLLVGAALLLGTFRALDCVDLGFARDHALLVTFDPYLAGHRGARLRQSYDQALERVRDIPGVRSVSLMREKLLSGRIMMSTIWVPGYAIRKGEDAKNLWVIQSGVGPRFFRTSGVQLLSGRDFSARDNAAAPKVAVINESFAKHFFPGKNALGQTIAFGPEDPLVEIVGIARDIKLFGARSQPQELIYTPFLQDPETWKEATLLVRTAGDPAQMVNSVRNVLHGIDSSVPVYDVTTMDRQVEATLVDIHLTAVLASLFGLLALGLAAIGLYGLLAYNVAQRTSEIGVRMALGACPRNILRLVLGETVLTLGAGVAAGIVLALAGARLIQSLLFGVAPTDAASLAAPVLVLLAVAALAATLPAIRASRIEPTLALRHQ